MRADNKYVGESSWKYNARTDGQEQALTLQETRNYDSQGALAIQYERAHFDKPRSDRLEA